jgi:hypothetical protein
MPVSAEQITYSPPSASETGESRPETSTSISIVDGTTKFNAGLDAKTFVIGFRTGKPTSASGRRRSDQYDRQTLAAKKIDAATQKAGNNLLAPEAEPVPIPDAVIQPASQVELRYVALALIAVAIIAFNSVRARRRLH